MGRRTHQVVVVDKLDAVGVVVRDVVQLTGKEGRLQGKEERIGIGLVGEQRDGWTSRQTGRDVMKDFIDGRRHVRISRRTI